MKRFIIIAVIAFTQLLFAQDITNKLGGNTANETYDVTDSGDNVLLRVQGDGKTGIGTELPDEHLHIDGNMRLDGTLEDKDGNAGTSGQILSSTVTGTDWITAPSTHDAVTIGTANGLSLSTQQLSLSTATTSAAGAMSSADKTKLDGLSSGGGNTLDQAYDQGGAGAGRTITADNGAFEVGGVDGVLFTGTYGTGTIPIEGAGTRLMWYPSKSAFRVGTINSNHWDADSIGDYSNAMGRETKAVGLYSFSAGYQSTARGECSTALGSSLAIGTFSTALGYGSVARGIASTAMGWGSTASGSFSTAIGHHIVAEGTHTLAIALDDMRDPLTFIDTYVTQDNTMSIMGGSVGIGTTTPEATLDVHGTVKAFGAWVQTYSTENAYQAPTDGFVHAWIQSNGGTAAILGYSDSNSNPTELRAAAVDIENGSAITQSIIMAVRKDDYWKVSDGFSGGYTAQSQINWIPLGQ